MANRPVDMRVFNTIGNDHAVYDAALVKQFEATESVWTRSAMIGTVGVTLEQFRVDAQHKLAETFSAIPELAKQDFTDRRKVLQHVAHQLVTLSTLMVHLQQKPGAVEQMMKLIRNNLIMLARKRVMIIQLDNHPLQHDYRTKSYEFKTDSGLQRYWATTGTDDDKKFAEHVAGGDSNLDGDIDHIRGIFEKAVPFLFTVDPAGVDSPLLNLRQQLFRKLEHRTSISPQLQKEMIRMIADDWMEMHAQTGASTLGRIEEEVEQETGIAHITDHNPATIFQTCFEPFLAQGIDLQDVRKTLLRLRPLLDMIVYEAIDNENPDLLRKAVLLFKVLRKDLQIDYAELGHLGLILAAQAPEIDIDTYRRHLL